MGTVPENHPLEASLVKIMDPSRRAVGGGFYVGTRCIATCAHVVYGATGATWKSERRNPKPRPHQLVRLQFPFLDGETFLAQVIAWDDQADFALLHLREAPPPGAFPARLIPGDVVGETYEVCGFPAPLAIPNGIWSDGTIAHGLPDGWLQMQSNKLHGIGVVQGFSGAPVWITSRKGVAGMVSRCSDNPNHGLAFCTPVLNLVERSLPERGTLPQFQLHTPHAKWHEYQRQLSAWLAQPGAPFALLLAAAGWGKSTLLEQWGAQVAAAEQAQVLHVKVRPQNGTTSRLGLLRALADALACRPAEGAPAGEEQALLSEIQQALAYRPHYRVLLIVDGISEVEDWPWDSSSEPLFPPAPDPMVKILVAARTVGDDAEGRIWLRRLRWPRVRLIKLSRLTPDEWADMLQCDPGLRSFALQRRDVVNSLYEYSYGGRPIVLNRCLQALRKLGDRVMYESADTLAQLVAEQFDAEAPAVAPTILPPPAVESRAPGRPSITIAPASTARPERRRLDLSTLLLVALSSALLAGIVEHLLR